MKSKKELSPLLKEILTLIITAIILTLAINYGKENPTVYESLIIFSIILAANFIVKKLVAYVFEISINVKPWEIRHFWFKEKNQFKKPVTMIWWPLLVSLLTMGVFWWLPILEFDSKAKPERAARRHQVHKFSHVTERHLAYIVFWSILTTLILGLLGHFLHFETFFRVSFFYALWSLVPISRLDGSKLFFGEKWLWFVTLILTCLIGIFVI